jgi:hypothetical protein
MRKLLIMSFLSIALVARAQEVKPFKMNVQFTLDRYGNAQVTFSMRMNASQWDDFKHSIGNNQSLLKRELERNLPSYFLSDFDYKEDAMDRSYSLSFKANGICKIDERGRWYAELDAKNPDITKLSDNVYMMITDMQSGGQLIQANSKFIFPDEASDIREEKDAFGKARFTFEMKGSSGRSSVVQYGGIVLVVVGLLLGWRNYRKQTLAVLKRPVPTTGSVE